MLARALMRPALALLLAGCSTVEHTTVVSTTRGPERCGQGDLVASVFPADWPNVTVEIVEQRSCATAIEEKLDVQRELKLPRETAYWIGAGLGAAAGVGASIALQAYTNRTPGSFNRGDGYLMLAFAGAAAGVAAVEGLNVSRQTQALPGEVRVVTSYESRADEHLPRAGLLSQAKSPLGELRHGRARLPLELAMAVYGRPLLLDGRRVEWSVRSNAWVPGRLPACVRLAQVQERGLTGLAAAELARAQDDADACAKDGWPFAGTMQMRIANECRERFEGSCRG